jgi:hypothetical protein
VADFPDMYPGTIAGKAGEMAGKTVNRGGRSASFFCMAVSPPTCPRGDGGPRLATSKSRDPHLFPHAIQHVLVLRRASIHLQKDVQGDPHPKCMHFHLDGLCKRDLGQQFFSFG